MNWENIKKLQCPACSNSLDVQEQLTCCNHCPFTISTNKLTELSKPKEQSVPYQKAKAKYKSIKKYNTQKREKLKKAKETQSKERLSNLRRMLDRGEITQFEYNTKTS